MKNSAVVWILLFSMLYLPLMKILLLLSACLFPFAVFAQENKADVSTPDSVGGFRTDIHASVSPSPVMDREPSGFGVSSDGGSYAGDTLRLPSFDCSGRVPINMYPAAWGGWYNWDLHKGLNISLGASVFASFGKGAWKGAGFAQNVSMMYAVPLTDRLSLAIGGYFNNMSWSHDSYRDAGLSAVLGYKFDEHWEGYVYGQKSLVNKMMPMPLYDMGNMGDRIGAAVKYNFNPSFSVTVSFEVNKRSFSDPVRYPDMNPSVNRESVVTDILRNVVDR